MQYQLKIWLQNLYFLISEGLLDFFLAKIKNIYYNYIDFCLVRRSFMKKTLAILVKNNPGVLKRVLGIFDDKGYNIDSLAVGVVDEGETSRITIVANASESESIINYLEKSDDVIRVKALEDGAFISRSHVLIKVKSNNKERGQVVQIADIFRAKVVDVSSETATLEITGEETKITALLGMLEDFGVLEVARAGSVAIERGTNII